MIQQTQSDPSYPPPAGLPAYLVGRDEEGHWLAVDTRGLAGGIFRSEAAATRYAQDETDHRPGAVMASAERLTLRL